MRKYRSSIAGTTVCTLRDVIATSRRKETKYTASTNGTTNILAVLRFKIPFQRDACRFKPFGTFRETTFKQFRNSIPGTLCSCREMTRLLFYGFGEARIIFLPSSENDLQR